MDFDPIPYNLQAAFIGWAQLVGILLAVGLVLGLLLAFLKNGSNGPGAFQTGLTSYFKEVTSISPKRILAITGLTLKEATRRKALLVFVVFAVLLMFGGWFLTDSNDRPELQFGVHVTFMLTVISWLILPIAIFLSCWGIPEDIRIRSLHTVVTKPVRRIEVVMGRMLGYSGMVSIIVLLMGFVGYIWIQRQVPATITTDRGIERSLMTCRVPVYGRLFFLDRKGLPKREGLNVGDSWLYRSFVEGNSASRAVWWFSNVTPESVGDELVVESRFEAFRTVKGSANSVQQGVEGQYTLVHDIRSDAFSSMGIGASFRDVADAFKDASFQLAADRLETAADNMISSPDGFPVTDCKLLALACQQAVRTLDTMGDEFDDVQSGFEVLSEAADSVKQDNSASYEVMAGACRALAVIVRERSEDLLASMPRIEVPLNPFAVSEFHEGDNVDVIPRSLTYAGNNEAAARFIAKTIVDLNDSGKLVDGSGINPDLSLTLQQEEIGISVQNADLIQELLETELAEEVLKLEDNQLLVSDGRRWLTYIDQLVREERLISLDAAGWVLTADLFEDLAPDGVLRVEVSCLNEQMYLGMARPDLFIRLKDRPFWVGYSKALLNIALMLCLVVVVGVTASCVVKGPVSFFLTLTLFFVGQFFHPFIQSLLYSEEGGGMIESAILMVQHRNPTAGTDVTDSSRRVIEATDSILTGALNGASKVIPDFSLFSDSATYIENGFDVPWASSVLPSLATFFGFLLPCILIGAACLKFRELEAK